MREALTDSRRAAPEPPLAVAAGLPPSAQQAPASASTPPLIAPADAPGGYLLRSALTKPPTPIGDVDLSWPKGLLPDGRLVGTFWLYIADTGSVDRVVPDDASLPPALEDIARRTFLAARFEPGQWQGRAARSLIRIEVVFDNRSSAAPPVTISAERPL